MRKILAGVVLGVPAMAQPVLTAVYTLADHHTIRWTAERDPVRKIAGVCQIAPGAPSATLACSGPPAGDARTGRRYFYTVALFRDLDENLYLAACAAPSRDDRCADLRAGQTFSVEVEDQTVRVVIDNEQLSLRILEYRPKPTTIDSPTRGTPSQVRFSPGTPSNPSWSNVRESPGTPSHVQPSQVPVSAASPSRISVSEVSVAAASPTAGRLWLYCETPQSSVFIDGKPVGLAPLEVPVVPGRHLVRVVAPGYREWSRTVIIPPGGSAKVTVELSR